MLTSIVTTAPMFTCLFWVMAYLLDYRKNDTCKRIMFWFMLTACVLYFGHFCYFQKEISVLYVTDSLYSFANLAVYPLYYLYIRKLTTNMLDAKSVILWLFPAIFVSSATFIAYLCESEEVRYVFFKSYLYRESVDENIRQITELVVIHVVARMIFAVQVIAVIILSFKKISRFNSRLKDFYSSLEERELTSVRSLMLTLVVVSLCSFILNALSKSFFVENIFVLLFPSCMFSLLLFYIGYDAYNRKFTDAVFSEEIRNCALQECKEEDKSDADIQESSDPIRLLAVRFDEIMRNEKLFLNSDLKVSDVTRRLGTNRDYLYQAISTCLNVSFADYVNRLRVEYAQQILNENPRFPLNEVIEKTGYTSESTFFRNFKKVTGMTPRQWLQEKH